MTPERQVADYMLSLNVSILEAARIVSRQMRDSELDLDTYRAISACRKRGSRQHYLSVNSIIRIFESEYPDYQEDQRRRAQNLFAKGKSVTEVARALGVTPRTIRNRRKKLSKEAASQQLDPA